MYGDIVFKDTERALEQAMTEYAEGFEAIRVENGYRPISVENYFCYASVAWDLYTRDPELRRQASAIARFLDIYENSFPDQPLFAKEIEANQKECYP